MILRKRSGMGTLVAAGTPYFRGQAPLLETDISTIEGVERLGGRFGVSVPPRFARGQMPYVPGSRRWGGVGVQGYRSRGLAGAAIANLSGGSNVNFRVGDSWRLDLSGAPANAIVALNASLCSPDFSRCAELPRSGQQDIALSTWLGKYADGNSGIGTTDAAGNFSMSGVFTPAQVGMWTLNWVVGGQGAGGMQFTVADASGNAQYGGPVIPSGVPYYMGDSNHPTTLPAPSTTPLSLADMLKQLGITLPGSSTPAGSPAGSPAASGGSYHPVVNFSSPRGNALVVGDQWTITISGAPPNAPVTVTGILNGSSSTTPVGTTDANGSFSKLGTATADTVGNWTESWKAGGLDAGTFSFTVSQAGAGSPAVTGGGAAPNTSGGGSSDTFDVGSLLSGSVFMGIPNWILLAGAAGAFLLFGGKR